MTENNWKLFFNSISDPVMILSLDNRILTTNPAAINATRISEKDLIGQYCFKFSIIQIVLPMNVLLKN